MTASTPDKQLLHLVIGGELKQVGKPEFKGSQRDPFRRRLPQLPRRLRCLERRRPAHGRQRPHALFHPARPPPARSGNRQATRCLMAGNFFPSRSGGSTAINAPAFDGVGASPELSCLRSFRNSRGASCATGLRRNGAGSRWALRSPPCLPPAAYGYGEIVQRATNWPGGAGPPRLHARAPRHHRARARPRPRSLLADPGQQHRRPARHGRDPARAIRQADVRRLRPPSGLRVRRICVAVRQRRDADPRSVPARRHQPRQVDADHPCLCHLHVREGLAARPAVAGRLSDRLLSRREARRSHPRRIAARRRSKPARSRRSWANPFRARAPSRRSGWRSISTPAPAPFPGNAPAST